MALVFTDEELKTASKEVITLPEQLALLQNQQQTALDEKAELLKKDNANSVFYDKYHDNIDAYIDELGPINGQFKTKYLTSTLVDAAKQVPGNAHYPNSPVWTNLTPKVLSENNGDPVSPSATYEIDALTKIPPPIDLLKNGYTDGSLDDTLYSAYTTPGTVEVDNGGFQIGDRIVIDSGGTSLLGTVLTVTPEPPVPPPLFAETLTFTVVVPPLGSLPAGARIRNFHPGFSNNEREGVTTPYAPEVMAYWESLVDPEITYWKTELDAQAAAQLLNDPIANPTELADLNTAISDVAFALVAVNNFFAAPPTGAGVGKYGDTILDDIETKRLLRLTQAPARATQIATYLGAVSQMGDGSFTGTLLYYTLFKWIDFRISLSGGSLLSYYGLDLVNTFITGQITRATDKLNEYSAVLVVKKLAKDSTGSQFIYLEDSTGFNPADTVKMVDDTHDIVTTTITSIEDDRGLRKVRLAVGVQDFTVDGIGRLVKQL